MTMNMATLSVKTGIIILVACIIALYIISIVILVFGQVVQTIANTTILSYIPLVSGFGIGIIIYGVGLLLDMLEIKYTINLLQN